METVLVSAILLIVGFVAVTAGYLMFRLLLPAMAFVVGLTVGFSGVVSIFGANVWSFAAAGIMAFLIGVLFAVLAYFYYTLGVMVVVGSILAGAFAFFGHALGLREDGFIVFLLSLTGAVLGGLFVLRSGLQNSLIVGVTSLFGVSAILAGFLLLFGNISVTDIYEGGVIRSVTEGIETTWLWLFALVGGTAIAISVQNNIIARSNIHSPYIYEPEASKRK